jgi:CBS domain-containing protein
MTIVDQVFETLGLTDGARRRLVCASRSLRRRGKELLRPMPSELIWLGAALIGGVAVSMLSRRALPFGGRRVADVMVRDVLTIDASSMLAEAAQMMRDGNVGVLPVVERGRLRGLLTDRDLVVRAMARNMDAAATPVRYVASEDLACARPEWDVEDAMRVMADCQVGRLPVVDDDERVVGIVTLSSLALRSREERDALHAAQQVSRRSARMVA